MKICFKYWPLKTSFYANWIRVFFFRIPDKYNCLRLSFWDTCSISLGIFQEFSFEQKIGTLTVLQSCVIGNVALVNLVFSCHGRKLNVAHIQDCSQYTVYTSKLLKHTIQMLASPSPGGQQGSGDGWGQSGQESQGSCTRSFRKGWCQPLRPT